MLVKWLSRFATHAVARTDYSSDSSDYTSDSDSDSDGSYSDNTELQQYYFRTDAYDFAALSEILQFATNLMKYNQSHFDENARHSIMVKVCTVS